MKNYIAISRDHSGSMGSLTRAAARDYNENIQSIKAAASQFGQDTIVSVMKCGVGRNADNIRESVNSSVSALKTLSSYEASGSATPLFDSVGELIEILESSPDAKDTQVSFLVMAITDGQDNASRKYPAHILSDKIRKLQATDRWTFVFRVPCGYASHLTRLGIPEGNIQEWEQTERGMQASTVQTRAAVDEYYKGLSTGVRSTKKFFTNLKDVDSATIKASLRDISNEVNLWIVKNAGEGATIREYCEKQLNGKAMLKGAAFYQLTKTEDEVQDYKQIAIRDKKTGSIYSGLAARDLLGLPRAGMCKVAPGDHGDYDIYIQSTSVNRKLPVGSTVLYWPNVGSKYQEGKSAR